MAWLENWPRPYYAKYDKVDIKNDQGWFDVYKLPHNVYVICEPQQAQEVNAFLVIGDDRALLIDTGMNVRNIKLVVDELYDGQVIAANTHCHFDHVGNNYLFEPVRIYDNPVARRIAKNGIKMEDVGGEMDEELFQFGAPEGYVIEDYHVNPYTFIPMLEGYQFELGNRIIEVLHTPGHSPDSVTFWDHENNIMWTGDLVYLGGIYTHFDNEIFGKSNIFDYVDTLDRLKDLADEKTLFYTSHNDLIMEYPKFCEIDKAFHDVIETEQTGKGLELDNGPVAKVHDYGEAKNQPHVYQFEDFSIFCKPGLK